MDRKKWASALCAAAQDLPPFLQEPVRMCGPCFCNELFERGNLSPSNVGMLGCSRLGAAFAQHGGSLVYSSKPGQGTTAVGTLPLKGIGPGHDARSSDDGAGASR